MPGCVARSRQVIGSKGYFLIVLQIIICSSQNEPRRNVLKTASIKIFRKQNDSNSRYTDCKGFTASLTTICTEMATK